MPRKRKSSKRGRKNANAYDDEEVPGSPADFIKGSCGSKGTLCYRQKGSSMTSCAEFCGSKCNDSLEKILETYKTASEMLRPMISAGNFGTGFTSEGFNQTRFEIFVRENQTSSMFAPVWPPQYGANRHLPIRTTPG